MLAKSPTQARIYTRANVLQLREDHALPEARERFTRLPSSSAPWGNRVPPIAGSTIGRPPGRFRHRCTRKTRRAHRSAACREKDSFPRDRSPTARFPRGARESAKTTALVARRRARRTTSASRAEADEGCSVEDGA